MNQKEVEQVANKVCDKLLLVFDNVSFKVDYFEPDKVFIAELKHVTFEIVHKNFTYVEPINVISFVNGCNQLKPVYYINTLCYSLYSHYFKELFK